MVFSGLFLLCARGEDRLCAGFGYVLIGNAHARVQRLPRGPVERRPPPVPPLGERDVLCEIGVSRLGVIDELSQGIDRRRHRVWPYLLGLTRIRHTYVEGVDLAGGACLGVGRFWLGTRGHKQGLIQVAGGLVQQEGYGAGSVEV